MNLSQRIISLVLIMASTVLVIEVITIAILYDRTIETEKNRLRRAARNQSRLIEAVARFDRIYSLDYPEGPRQATIDQVKDSQSWVRGFGRTGEFILAEKEKQKVVFIWNHRQFKKSRSETSSAESSLTRPMELALAGRSGTMMVTDYRGEKVLAAYEPVEILDLGIVAKIDLAEIRAPFFRASITSGILAIALIGFGVVLFFRISHSIVLRDYDTRERLQKALDELKLTEQILSTAQKVAHIGSWHFDLEKNKLIWTEEVYRIFGLNPREFEPSYESFLERVHPDDRELVDRAYQSSIADNTTYDITHRIIRPAGEIRHVHEKSEDIRDESGRTIHSYGMVHDITEIQRYGEERERLIGELQQSLSEIKTLKGIVPICASCKEIRDDQGYWHRLEEYIRDHSEAEFSHGICPKCAEKLYPEFISRKKDK